jgi:hypothetical protein
VATVPPQPASAPAGDPAAAAPAAAPAAAGDDSRIANLEREQQRQGHLLEKIAAGMGAAGPAAGPAAAGETPPPLSLADQVRKEIADADQRRKSEEDEHTWRAGVTDMVEQLKAERAPREPEKGVRARVQRALFGAPD